MSGFFSLEETQSKTRTSGKIMSCAACGLYKNAHTPRMKPYGEFEKKIMVIGGMPTERDDRLGIPWQSKFGGMLKRELQRRGVNFEKDILSIHSLACHSSTPLETASALGKEILCCRQKVLSAILKYEPKLVLLVGDLALQSVIGAIWTKNLGTMAKWRGHTIPDETYKTWLCPIFDPEYVSVQDAKEYRTIWRQDIENALNKLDEPLPHYPKADAVRILETESEIAEVLSELLGRKFPFSIAIDYETTGLKPHDTATHKIVCISLATNPEDAIVFRTPKSKRGLQLLKEVLQSEKIGKVAQNMKFEHTWTQNILGYEVKNWVWDTMLATHILDNRPDVTGLKFQTYVNFGVAGYDDAVAQYLRGEDPKNSNSVNALAGDLPKEVWNKVLHYCGLDSLFTYRLATEQKRKIEMRDFDADHS